MTQKETRRRKLLRMIPISRLQHLHPGGGVTAAQRYAAREYREFLVSIWDKEPLIGDFVAKWLKGNVL